MVSVLDNVVPPAVESARRWLKRERSEHLQRDVQIRRLNNAYDSKLYDLDNSGNDTVMTRTMKDSIGEVGQGSNPRYSEIPVPMVRAITEDWKSLMAVSPNHACPPVSPGEDQSEREADRREQIVSGIFWDSAMDFRIQEGAHYRSLHGAELCYCLPDPTDKRVRIESRSPYRTYARLINNRRELMYMGWDWEEVTEYVLEMYPTVEKYLDETNGVTRKGGRTTYPDKIVMTEWYDRNNRVVLVGDKWVDDMPYVNHKWGFVPGQVIPNIVGVGLWGQSDALYAVHLSQLYSEMLSMVQDGLFQNIYDIPIIFDDQPVGKVQVGPHEALQMSSKAHTGSLRGDVKMAEGSLILDILERVARIGSGWPKTQSSEMDTAVISGKAFVAAQGPVAARAALKHVIHAMCLERVTGYALKLYEHHFPNDEIKLMAVAGPSRTSVVAERSAMGNPVAFVPSRDIAGNYTVFVNFPPGGSDQYRSTIEQLQLVEAGIISAETVRQNRPGIDPKAERMRIERETQEKAQLQADAATVMARASMNLQMEQAMAMAQAQAGAAGAAGQPGQPPAQAPPGQGAPAPQGAAPAPTTGQEPPARAQAVQGAQQGQQGEWQRVTRAEVRAEMALVKPIRGRVFLMGAIARLGWSTGVIEVGLTDMVDKATLAQKTSFGRQGRLIFQKIDEDSPPNARLIDVTPKQ